MSTDAFCILVNLTVTYLENSAQLCLVFLNQYPCMSSQWMLGG